MLVKLKNGLVDTGNIQSVKIQPPMGSGGKWILYIHFKDKEKINYDYDNESEIRADLKKLEPQRLPPPRKA